MLKKSISNIAWPLENQKWVLKQLEHRHWDAIEVAPSRIWNDFSKIKYNQRKEYLESAKEFELRICSIHSLFYGIKDVNIFGSVFEQKNFQNWLYKLVELASDLEADVLVLGSPTVRDRKNIELERAMEIAANLIRKPADYAKMCGVKILIEPLTKQETNFINSHVEAMKLIKLVDNDGFGLHLDAKAIANEVEEIESIIRDCNKSIQHFHINDPGLGAIGKNADYHSRISLGLKEISYSNYISIEMRQLEEYRNNIINSLDYIDTYYDNANE